MLKLLWHKPELPTFAAAGVENDRAGYPMIESHLICRPAPHACQASSLKASQRGQSRQHHPELCRGQF